MPVEEEGAEARAAEEVATAADRVRRPASALQLQIELSAVKLFLPVWFDLEFKNNLRITGDFFYGCQKLKLTLSSKFLESNNAVLYIATSTAI